MWGGSQLAWGLPGDVFAGAAIPPASNCFGSSPASSSPCVFLGDFGTIRSVDSFGSVMNFDWLHRFLKQNLRMVAPRWEKILENSKQRPKVANFPVDFIGGIGLKRIRYGGTEGATVPLPQPGYAALHRVHGDAEFLRCPRPRSMKDMGAVFGKRFRDRSPRIPRSVPSARIATQSAPIPAGRSSPAFHGWPARRRRTISASMASIDNHWRLPPPRRWAWSCFRWLAV